MTKFSLIVFLSRLKTRERVAFYVTVLIVGLMLLDRLLLSPIFAKMEELDKKVEFQEDLIRTSLMISMQEKKIRDESELYTPYLSEPASEEQENTTFLKEIENFADEAVVYLVNIKPSGKKEMGTSTQYFLKLDFEAQMEQVFKFFHNIEHSDKLFKIESYQLAPKTEGSSIVTCSLSISKVIIPK